MSIRRFGGNRLNLITPSSFCYAAKECRHVIPFTTCKWSLRRLLKHTFGGRALLLQRSTLPIAYVQSGKGRDLMRVVHIAVDRFPEYA